MALLARHRFMVNRLAEAFECEESGVEKMMLQKEVLRVIDFFFTVDGPTKIVITQETGTHSLTYLLTHSLTYLLTHYSAR